MDLKFLEFEQPIAELEAKIDELRYVGDDSEININEEVARLKSKSESLTKSIFAKLSAWQIAQVARHPMRPYTADYLEAIAPDFQELHGDRMYGTTPLAPKDPTRRPAARRVAAGASLGGSAWRALRASLGGPG